MQNMMHDGTCNQPTLNCPHNQNAGLLNKLTSMFRATSSLFSNMLAHLTHSIVVKKKSKLYEKCTCTVIFYWKSTYLCVAKEGLQLDQTSCVLGRLRRG